MADTQHGGVVVDALDVVQASVTPRQGVRRDVVMTSVRRHIEHHTGQIISHHGVHRVRKNQKPLYRGRWVTALHDAREVELHVFLDRDEKVAGVQPPTIYQQVRTPGLFCEREMILYNFKVFLWPDLHGKLLVPEGFLPNFLLFIKIAGRLHSTFPKYQQSVLMLIFES